jgi:RimJ/RimL family protein N-acetyltransferase/ubiquinone/menaquinone biosynthesis C-methylase UbiE
MTEPTTSATNADHLQSHWAGMSWTGLAAQVWDPSGGDDPQNDHDFIRRLIEANPGPALDIGCGTGRLLLRYMAAGLDVDGIDTSADMLRLCREKAQAQGLPMPRLYEQAMQALDLPRTYQTIFIPCGSLVLITDHAQAREALQCFYDHLEPGGTLLVSAFWPFLDGEALDQSVIDSAGEWRPLFDSELPDGSVIRQHIRRVSTDITDQTFQAERRYRLYRDDALLREEIFGAHERWYYRHELALLLENAGFEQVEIKGNYTDADFDARQHYVMVALARKPQESPSSMKLPTLETERLSIRRFTLSDLPVIHQVYKDAGWVDEKLSDEQALALRRRWLQWTIRNYDALADLYQPPYGDYAIVLKAENRVIGGVGLVPLVGPFGQLPYYQARGLTTNDDLNMPEFGLFWALLRDYQGHGYATEAAQAMIDYAFDTLNIRRIVATTGHDNPGSMAVMRRLGMRVEYNPMPEPAWFEVAGVLENPKLTTQTNEG